MGYSEAVNQRRTDNIIIYVPSFSAQASKDQAQGSTRILCGVVVVVVVVW